LKFSAAFREDLLIDGFVASAYALVSELYCGIGGVVADDAVLTLGRI
jgi:hypothetical protein